MIILVDANKTKSGVGICEFSEKGVAYIGVYATCGCTADKLSTAQNADDSRIIICDQHGVKFPLGQTHSRGWALYFRTSKEDEVNVMDRIHEWVADMLNVDLSSVEVTWNGR